MSQSFDRMTRLRRHARLTSDVFRLAGWFAATGRTSISDGSGLIAEFEDEFRAMTGAEFALAMNSGTAALHSAYFAVGVRPGTEVIVPSYTWQASATPILQCGAKPVFCDVDPLTLTIDPADIERRITEHTRAICAVHLWGNPARLDRIVAIAKEYGLSLIEDCSHAHGAVYDGRPVGSWGDVGCFSLHASKPVAAGEAGVAVTSDPTILDRMILLGHVGRPRTGYAMQGRPGDDGLGIADLGVKYRPHLFAVHLAQSQLRRLPQENARRERLWYRIAKELEDSACFRVPSTLPKARRGGYYRFVAEYTGGASVEAVVGLARSSGVPVETDKYGRNLLHEAPVFSRSDVARLLGHTSTAVATRKRRTLASNLPVCESVGPRMIAFDQLSYLAPPLSLAFWGRELRRVAEMLDAHPSAQPADGHPSRPRIGRTDHNSRVRQPSRPVTRRGQYAQSRG